MKISDKVEQKLNELNSHLTLTYPLNFVKIVEELGGKIKQNKTKDPPQLTYYKDTFCLELHDLEVKDKFDYHMATQHLSRLILHWGYDFKTKKIIEANKSKASVSCVGVGYDVNHKDTMDLTYELLLPRIEFKAVVDNCTDRDSKICNLEKVSDYFNVSISTITLRGKSLGILE